MANARYFLGSSKGRRVESTQLAISCWNSLLRSFF